MLSLCILFNRSMIILYISDHTQKSNISLGLWSVSHFPRTPIPKRLICGWSAPNRLSKLVSLCLSKGLWSLSSTSSLHLFFFSDFCLFLVSCPWLISSMFTSVMTLSCVRLLIPPHALNLSDLISLNISTHHSHQFLTFADYINGILFVEIIFG